MRIDLSDSRVEFDRVLNKNTSNIVVNIKNVNLELSMGDYMSLLELFSDRFGTPISLDDLVKVKDSLSREDS